MRARERQDASFNMVEMWGVTLNFRPVLRVFCGENRSLLDFGNEAKRARNETNVLVAEPGRGGRLNSMLLETTRYTEDTHTQLEPHTRS